ncbi:MAG: hypothetical protein AAF487_00870 [Bacteroidota bacterium]
MDVTRLLYDTENNLRSYIDLVFAHEFGSNWYYEMRIPKKRLQVWEINRIPNELEPNAIKGKEKLIQYAPFEDIIWILKRKWNATLQKTFGDFEHLEVYLKIMQDYRNPESRRRELLTYQKHLILGVAGEINARITRARSVHELGNPGYPRIHSVKDSFGNLWTAGSPKRIKTNMALRTGDKLEFNITASDPEERELKYKIQSASNLNLKWQSSHVLLLEITRKMIGKAKVFNIIVKNDNKYHAYQSGYDDRVSFEYDILPFT